MQLLLLLSFPSRSIEPPRLLLRYLGLLLRRGLSAGVLEFVPAMEYPEISTLVWSTNGGPSSEILPPEIAGQSMRAEDWDGPGATESNDGSLSAPIVYASLVLGMITVFRDDAETAASRGGGQVLEEGRGGEAGRVLPAGALPAEDGSAEPAAAWGEQVRGSGSGRGPKFLARDCLVLVFFLGVFVRCKGGGQATDRFLECSTATRAHAQLETAVVECFMQASSFSRVAAASRGSSKVC